MKRFRQLTDEDRRLWAAIAETAMPLGRRERAAPAAPTGAPAASPPPAPPHAPAKASSARVPPSLMPSYRAEPPSGKTAGFHPIERPVRRKIAKGRLPIEARIDLHDRTQVVAHYVLLGFLRQAQAEDMRVVLVITGRGASFGSRGVIRRQLPHWFETPEFRRLVSGFEPAERTHGGDGAFYVRIRRR